MSFGRHLRTLREAAALSRAGLARKTGVSASTLRNWEGDRGFPGPAAGVRLAGALGVTLERLSAAARAHRAHGGTGTPHHWSR